MAIGKTAQEAVKRSSAKENVIRDGGMCIEFGNMISD